MATERSVLVRLKASVGPFVAGMTTAQAAVRGLTKEIDTSNDRTAWLAQSILALGPALVPLGAAAVPILSGLAMQMMLTAGAAGTAALAFSGIGDALGAVNDYQLDPTVANLEKMNQALAKVGPDGAEFVAFLDEIGPKFADLQMAAREGMFPGVEEGLTSFLDLLPRVRNIVTEVSEAMGELAASAGAGLAGEGFADFFDYLERNAKPLLIELGQTIGNFAEGLGAMMVALEPLTAQFSSGFESMSASFADWAHGLDDSSSFAEFVAYVQQSIPRALDMLSSLSDAFVSLLQAAAPVGDVMLPVLELLFDALSVFLDSPFGPVFLAFAAAVSFYGRAAALASITTGGLGKTMFATTINAKGLKSALDPLATSSQSLGRAMLPGIATAGLMGFAMSDLDDKAGLTNTTMGALLGTIGGPWGVAIGAGIGLLLDFKSAGGETTDTLRDMNAMMAAGQTDAAAYAAKVEEASARTADLATAIPTSNLDALWSSFTSPDTIKLNFQMLTGQIDDSALAKQAVEANAAEMAYGDYLLAVNEVGRALGMVEWGESVQDVAGLNEIVARAKPAMDALGISIEDLVRGARDGSIIQLADQIGRWQSQADSAGGRTLALGATFRDLNNDMLSTADTASALANALDQLLSPQMNLSEATDAWREGLRNLNDDLAKNNKSLRGNTDAADKNREVIRDRVERMQALLVAEAEAGASSGQLSRMLRQQRQALIEAGVAANMSRGELKDYLNTLGLTPKMVRTILALNTESALASLRQARRELEAMNGKTYLAIMEIRTVYKTVGNATDALPDRTPSARGNIFSSVRHNAYGDIANRHQPELAGPGVTRVWREPETQGEAYIPLANDDRRPRAKSIAEQTVALLGGAVMWNARGNLVAGRGGSGVTPAPVIIQAPSAVGLRIEGRIEMTADGAYLRGIVADEIDADRRFDRTVRGR